MMAIAQKCSLNLTHLPGTEEVKLCKVIYHLRNIPGSVQVELKQQYLWYNVDLSQINFHYSLLLKAKVWVTVRYLQWNRSINTLINKYYIKMLTTIYLEDKINMHFNVIVV